MENTGVAGFPVEKVPGGMHPTGKKERFCMEIKDLEMIWSAVDMPVVVVPKGGSTQVYENALAAELLQGDLFAALPASEAQPLREAVEGLGDPPFFCHLGAEVYSAVLVPQGDFLACLLHRVTTYYDRTQNALNEAIMANKAKTNFLSEMSHDIRTPMGAIVGLTDIALTHPDSALKVRECLEKIKVASGHMMSLLNEVLDMSRIESGRISIQAEPANVADLLHEILIVARPQAEAGGLEFHLDMGPIASENLMLDTVRLKQVCLNLLSNAIKYTPTGGKVELYFAIEPGPAPEQVWMDVRVQDNGIGMTKEFLTKVFAPFEREARSVVNKIQGTGLGMAITKNLVELMNGSITVESQVGEGSLFTLRIPFDRAPASTGPWEALRGRRVLLLEGDAKQARLTQGMLDSLGIAASWAQDEDQLILLMNDADLDGTEYDLFLTAEKLEGAELTLLLPEVRRRLGSGVPMLLLAGSDWSQIEYVFTRSGVDGFIPLPLFQSRLAAGLLSYTSGGAAPEEVQAPRCDLADRRLLLAEDNELNREIAQELLGEAGCAIECAENGRVAVEMFQASARGYYDVVLMDVQMPEMNGLDATRAIRALDRPDARAVPIIAMTANAFVEDVKNSLDAGMDAHISKPLDMDKVFSTIDSLLRGR